MPSPIAAPSRSRTKIEDIEACEKAGLTPYVPKPQRGSPVREGFFRKDEFRRGAELDVFICPAGQALSPRYESKPRDLKKIDHANRAACLVCPVRSRCTNGYRKAARVENEAVLDRMAARLKARPDILGRQRTVEHRQHQAMDEPGRLSNEGPRQCPRRVQPHGARLQSAAGPQHPWRRCHDGGRSSMKRRSCEVHSRPE